MKLIKKNTSFYLSILFACLIFICNCSFAQLTVTPNISATNAANLLVGSGVSISNATFTGVGSQLGSFTGGNTYIGFDEGIILTTGKSTHANGNNSITNTCGTDQASTASSSDADLNQIASAPIYSAAILEFDVVSSGDKLEFNFSFASEEYLEWVNTSHNDVFGFFISGPGISGPYSNNAKNIALIPGTNQVVSINNVNHLTNTSFFIDNSNNFGAGTIVYDGYTVNIKVSCPVQFGQTYHLRLAIANVLDANCDSGVLLKKGSLVSGPPPPCVECPNYVYIENRTPATNPLKGKVYANNRIMAGESVYAPQTDGPVITGIGALTFRAGDEIFLKPGFTANPGFETYIGNDACNELCNYCANWPGFTVSIPNVFTPNGDGINDIWYVNDVNNPFCAFNAQEFDLKIYNRWSSLLYHSSQSSYSICPFQSPAPSNPISHSSIFWPGTHNGNLVPDGVYDYVLELKACGNQQTFTGNISIFGSPARITVPDEEEENHALGRKKGVVEQGDNQTSFRPIIYPNPIQQYLTVELLSDDISQLRLVSMDGKIVLNQLVNKSITVLELSRFEAGVYFLYIESNGKQYREKVIKL